MKQTIYSRSRLTLLLVVFTLSLGAWAQQTAIVDGIIYSTRFENSAGIIGVQDWSITRADIPEEVEIGGTMYPVTYIDCEAFSGCSLLTSVYIPASVESLCDPFTGCSALTEINVAEDNPELCSVDGVLYDKEKTTLITCPPGKISVRVPSTVTDIGFGDIGRGFDGCAALTSVELPASLKSICWMGFAGCSSLTSLDLPEGLTYVEGSTFQGCSSLTTIHIPASLGSVSGSDFVGCSSLTSVTVALDNPNMSSVDGVLYNKNKTALILCPNGKTSVNIPTTVTRIYDYAFDGCARLTSIEIPASVTGIDSHAFANCTSLTSMKLPSSLEYMKSYVFLGCTSLISVDLPETLTEIPISTFTSCTSLSSIDLPDSLTAIYDYAFQGCTSLSSIDLPDGLATISHGAFTSCTSLSEISIPSTVKNIAEYAFSQCKFDKMFLYAQGVSNHAFLRQVGINALYAYPDKWNSIKTYFSGNLYDITQRYFVTLETQKLAALSWTIRKNDALHGAEALSIVSVADSEGNILTPDADGLYTVNGLVPGAAYAFFMKYSLNGVERDTTLRFTTAVPVLKVTSTRVTAKTLTFTVSASYDDTMKPSEVGIWCNGFKVANADSVVVLTGLHYNSSYSYYAYGRYGSGTYSNTSQTVKTADVSMSLSAYGVSAGVTQASVTGSFDPRDLTVKGYGIKIGSAAEWKQDGSLPVNKSTRATAHFTGLRPNMSYAVTMWMDTEEEGMIYRSGKYWEEVTTGALTFETQPASATSNTSSTISAATNCDAETGTGFEWRRNDAPDLVPSSYEECPVVDGVMAGSLRGLSADTYYQYRPYYQAADGTYFYGDWIGFGTADAYVYFEPTVRTLDVETLSPNSAMLTGYALAGSDDITAQGFEFWPLGAAVRGASGRQTVEANGQKMIVTLGGLEPNTTYAFRAYVTTARGTTYGDEQTFTTPATTGIDAVTTVDKTIDVAVRGASVRGLQVRVVAAGGPQAVCRLVSLSGAVVASMQAVADGEWRTMSAGTLSPGVYLLHVRAAGQVKTLKLMLR